MAYPPSRGKSGETAASRGVSRQGRNQDPLCTIGFHSALEKMAWKEIGT